MALGITMRLLQLLLLTAILVLGSMTIVAVPSRAQYGGPSANPLHFFGNGTRGWGGSPTTITSPGPELRYDPGTRLTFVGHSVDGQAHNFQVGADTPTGTFSSSGFNWFNLTLTTQQGQFTYRCTFHPTVMYGTMIIGNPGGGLSLTYIIAIVVVIVVVAAVVAVVLMRRRSKTPPST